MKRITGFTMFVVICFALLFSAGAAFAAPWKFAVLCDSRSSYASDTFADKNNYYDATYGISPYFQNIAAALMRETGIDFVLYPGDLVRGKKPALSDAQFATDLQQWLTQMNSSMPVYYVRGNHDAGNTSTVWTSSIPVPSVDPVVQDASQPGLSYSFTHNGSIFVGLDEYPSGAAGATGYDSTFLRAELAKKAQHKFVFAHQPVWNFKASELGPAGLADDMNSGGVDLYFSGHVHSYQRIVEKGYNFQEMVIGTGGAPQDDPTLGPGGTGYVADPNLTVLNYTGGAGTNARFGYAVITVNDDGSITTEMKLLDDPTSMTSTVTTFDSNKISKPWKFGVMSDTQWPTSPDFKNPNVAVNVANHLNQEFINKGVKFVVQVGDLTDKPSVASTTTRVENLDIRAAFTQALYDAGIGFYPLRGNHEDKPGSPAAAGTYALEFQRIFPQTGTVTANSGWNNMTPSDAILTSNSTATYYPGTPIVPTTPTFTVGRNFVSEPSMEGLTYSFDVDNARFVLIDQFTKPNNTAHANLDQTDVNWIGDRLCYTGQLNSQLLSCDRPVNTHAFSFAHKGLVTENHADNMFNSTNPTASQASKDLMESFMMKLQNADVRYHMGGHDHMHNRAIVSSPNSGNFKVQNIIAASDSYKFYIPPVQATYNNQSAFRILEKPIVQELFTVGYYIFTVDGPRVTAEYYAMPNGCGGDCDQTYDVIPYADNTPTSYNSPYAGLVTFANPVPFTKHDVFGYSLNGKEVLVAQGGSYALTDDTTKAIANGETGYKGTTAAILSGKNNSTGKDYNLRSLTKSINTGWAAANAAEMASDIFTLWGMQDSLATQLTPQAAAPTYNNYTFVDPNLTRTDTYALTMSYDPSVVVNSDFINAGHSMTLSTKDAGGNWVNAVDQNVGGRKRFILGKYNSAYPLGTYGVDAATHTAWAVINNTGGPAEFAVVKK